MSKARARYKEKVTLTGNHAVALAVKLARVDLVSAYPITPQTSIVEKLSEYIESGELRAQMVRVESEHSALAVAYGAALAGARVFTATSSHGLLYMHEWVHWFSRARVPGVMAVVTRTIGAPWNIWPDHSDFMDQRDAGWVMAFARDNQEVLDLTIQAFKVSEDERVFLPFMVGLEGFILGHTAMPVDIPSENDVAEWLGERKQPYVIDGSFPFGVGGLTWPRETEEMFIDLHKSLRRAELVFEEVDKDYGKLFGRSYGGPLECYRCSDAKYYFVTMGAWSGDAMDAVDFLRERGFALGLARIRLYRPFPYARIANIMGNARGVIVFDRSVSFGASGPIYSDVMTSLLKARFRGDAIGIIAGVGGVDVTSHDFSKIAERVLETIERGERLPSIAWYHGGELAFAQH